MTKHFLPDELIFKADYIRADDGAIMREVNPGWFENKHRAGVVEKPPEKKPAAEKSSGAKPSGRKRRLYCEQSLPRASNDNVPTDLGRFNPTGHWIPKKLPQAANDDTALSTEEYRAVLNLYRVNFPQSDVAEHEIFGRNSRNASARYGDAQLKTLREYMEIHRTIEPNRSLWSAGVARSDKYEDGQSPERLEEIWSDPSITYEIRTVSTVGFAPRLSECGYATPHFSREMKIPTSGPVTYWGVSASDSQWCEKAVRTRLGKRVVKQETIDAKVAALCTPKILSCEDRGMKVILSLNGIEFAPERSERNGRTTYRGQMLKINGNDIDDRIRKPEDLECPGSDERFWNATDGVKFGKKSIDDLKFYANDPDLNPSEELEYGEEPDFDTEPAGDGVTPFDVLAQKQTLAAVDRMMLPDELTVAGTLMGINVKAAQHETDIGRALAGPRRLAEKTLERRGGKAVDALVEKIHSVMQRLAA
jgi:hypothetical protein